METHAHEQLRHADRIVAKQTLRRIIKEKLYAIPQEQRIRMSQMIRVQLARFIQQHQYTRIALFAPLPHEVNLLPLLQQLPFCEWYFPRVQGKRQMSFHRVCSQAELHMSKSGIHEPSVTTLTCSASSLQLIVLPGLAFTRQGDRMGYGGGFYDTLLHDLHEQVETVAVCFSCQIVDILPTEPHDIPVNRLITETCESTTC